MPQYNTIDIWRIGNAWWALLEVSTTQTTGALSSEEAELGGISRGASVALGFKSLANDLGIDPGLENLTDATAAIGICRRRGLGKNRHLHTADVWVQDQLQQSDSRLTKVLGAHNTADLLTNHAPRDVMRKHMTKIGRVSEDGKAASAPK